MSDAQLQLERSIESRQQKVGRVEAVLAEKRSQLMRLRKRRARQQRHDELPETERQMVLQLERLEAEIGKLEQLLADPELFTREPVKFKKATQALVERQEKLMASEEEWLMLEERAAG